MMMSIILLFRRIRLSCAAPCPRFGRPRRPSCLCRGRRIPRMSVGARSFLLCRCVLRNASSLGFATCLPSYDEREGASSCSSCQPNSYSRKRWKGKGAPATLQKSRSVNTLPALPAAAQLVGEAQATVAVLSLLARGRRFSFTVHLRLARFSR
ncbi:unnamed protein product [Amoebophrya sp. A120]|nr:unnamed protein product [Amoebophrya sp. A120]|eukprot:GSA120T00025440001.1